MPSLTFRVSGVPRKWDSDRLKDFLEEDGSTPTVVSFAREIHGRSSSATVTYQDSLRSKEYYLKRLLPKPPEAPHTRSEYLTVDADFVGITTLFAPPEEDHRVDIIAISGLGGHAFGSFREKDGDFMWLRDALPYDLTDEASGRPMARLMVYGYESAVNQSQSEQDLEDLANSFYYSLRQLDSSQQMKPILFIAHSLGGLIVKQMLIFLARSKTEGDRMILQAVYGIVFFGVPHDGMDIKSLVPMAGKGPNLFLLLSISRNNSQIRGTQQRDFYSALGAKGEYEVVCFYETLQSPTATKDESGRWAMTGPPEVLVTKSSATHCQHWEYEPEHPCPIARSHSKMVKFRPNDPEYEKVCSRLTGLARRGLAKSRRSCTNTTGTPVIEPPTVDLQGRLKESLASSSASEKSSNIPAPRRVGGLYRPEGYEPWNPIEIDEIKVSDMVDSSMQNWMRSPSGNLVIWGDDPKTWLRLALRQIALTLSQAGHSVLYISPLPRLANTPANIMPLLCECLADCLGMKLPQWEGFEHCRQFLEDVEAVMDSDTRVTVVMEDLISVTKRSLMSKNSIGTMVQILLTSVKFRTLWMSVEDPCLRSAGTLVPVENINGIFEALSTLRLEN